MMTPYRAVHSEPTPNASVKYSRERGVADVGLGDVGQERLELGALGEAEQAHQRRSRRHEPATLEPASRKMTKLAAPPR